MFQSMVLDIIAAMGHAGLQIAPDCASVDEGSKR